MKYFSHFTSYDVYTFYTLLLLVSGIIIWQKKSYFSNSGSKNTEALEYLLMGRRISLPMFIATLVATCYGAILGVTQISFERGIYNFITQGLFYYLSAAIFAMFLVKKARRTKAKTFPEMIAKIYGKKSAKTTAIILFITSLPIGSTIAMGIYTSGLFDLEIQYTILIGLLCVGLYCIFGGMKSIIVCDIIQFSLMYFSIILVLICSYHQFGGIEYLEKNLPSYYFYPTSNQSLSIFVIWLVFAMANTFLSPSFYQRCFAAKSESVARNGIFISILFWFVCDICTTLGGMYAKAHLQSVSAIDGYILHSLYVLPSGFKGIFLATIFVTTIFALDASLFTASTALFYDLSKQKSEYISLNKKLISMLIVVFVTYCIAIQFDGKIEKAWLTINSISLSAVLVPLLFGMFKRELISDKSCSYIIGINFIFSIIWTVCGLNAEFPTLYFGIFLSLAMFAVLHSLRLVNQ